MPHLTMKHQRMKHEYNNRLKLINTYTSNINRIISCGNIRTNSSEYSEINMYINKINRINKKIWLNPISIDSFICKKNLK